MFVLVIFSTLSSFSLTVLTRKASTQNILYVNAQFRRSHAHRLELDEVRF